MAMKTNDFYMGRLDSNIYEDYNLVKIEYPKISNFREYKVFSEDGLAIKTGDDKQVLRYFGSSFELPTPNKPKTIKLKGPADSKPIEYTMVCTKDEDAYKAAQTQYNSFHSALRAMHYEDTVAEHCPSNLQKAASALYSEAWTRGHSAGFNEVESYFIDCVSFAEDLLRHLEE